MKTVYKYEIAFGDEAIVQIPQNAVLLKFGIQGTTNGKPNIYVWAMVDTEARLLPYHFRIFGTGHPIPDFPNEYFVYCDTLFDRNFVWHIFRQL